MTKKKRQGHYCKICGEYKANERFTGKGHATHICKSCQSLPPETKTDQIRCRQIERLMDKYPLTRNDWDFLEKCAKKFAGKESGEIAQDILEIRRGVYTQMVKGEEEDIPSP